MNKLCFWFSCSCYKVFEDWTSDVGGKPCCRREKSFWCRLLFVSPAPAVPRRARAKTSNCWSRSPEPSPSTATISAWPMCTARPMPPPLSDLPMHRQRTISFVPSGVPQKSMAKKSFWMTGSTGGSKFPSFGHGVSASGSRIAQASTLRRECACRPCTLSRSWPCPRSPK